MGCIYSPLPIWGREKCVQIGWHSLKPADWSTGNSLWGGFFSIIQCWWRGPHTGHVFWVKSTFFLTKLVKGAMFHKRCGDWLPVDPFAKAPPTPPQIKPIRWAKGICRCEFTAAKNSRCCILWRCKIPKLKMTGCMDAESASCHQQPSLPSCGKSLLSPEEEVSERGQGRQGAKEAYWDA